MVETFSFEDVAPNPRRGLTLTPANRQREREPVLTQADYGQVAIPSGSLLPTDSSLRDMITSAASKYGVPLPIIMAMAQQESSYNPEAVGPATKYGHARGLMQYLDSTARSMGIDPLDPRQSLDAAAKQFSERMGKGLEWAIGAHHAGDNPRQHGPKTREYVASVMAKAAAIAKELGIDFELPTPPPTEGPETFSFEDALSDASPGDVPVPGTPPPQNPEERKEGLAGGAAQFADDYAAKFSPAAFVREGRNALRRGWEGLQEILNRDTREVQLSEQELRAEWEEARRNDNRFFGAQTPDFDTYKRMMGNTRRVSASSFEDEELEWRQRLRDDPSQADMLPTRFKHLAPEPGSANHEGGWASFINTLRNPMELLTRDSLPANFVSWLANQPELERKRYDDARKAAMQMNIVNNPDQFPEVSVQAAQRAIDERRARQEPDVRAMWDNLTQAAKDDPGRFGGELVNALIADPELLFAPVGVGLKPVQAVQAARGQTVASRAARIADQIIDAGTTSAAVNVAVGVGQNLAETGIINSEEVKLNAAMGAAIGGPMGLIFMRGARARGTDLQKAKADGTYEQILKDMAEADVAMEDIISGDMTNAYYRAMARDVRQVEGVGVLRNAETVNKLLGITRKTDRQKLINQRRKEIKDTFANESDYADYLQYVADERMQRAHAMAEARRESAERRARSADEARLSAEARRAELQKQFDEAVEARNRQEFDSLYEEALNEDAMITAARKLNNEEYLEALYTKDDPTIRQTEARIGRRDAQLRRNRKNLRFQRGEVDPTLLARIGVAGTAAGAAYALSPDDYKMTNTVMLGLAGLLVPGPGRTSIPSRMRQAGMIDPEGNIVGMLIKQGRLANKLEASDIQARDNILADRAAAGDQGAFKSLYDNYFQDTRRYVNKYMRELNEKAGLDAEDITQEAFLKAFQNMDSYSRDSPFGAWIKSIARNTALDAIDKMNAQKRGANYSIVGDDIPGTRDAYSGDAGVDSNVYERGAGADPFDTPEGQAMYRETATQLERAFQKLSPEMQDAIIKSQLENYTDVEIAELTHTPLGTIQRRVQRGKEALTNAIKEEMGGHPYRGPRSQRGAADPATLKKVGMAAAGATLGWAMSEDDPVWGLGIGTVAGLLLSGKVGASIVQGADYGLGIVSTRVRNHSPAIHRSVVNMFRRTLEDIHANFQKVDPFLERLRQFPQDVQDVTHRALMTGDPVVIKKWLDHLGDRQLIDGYKNIRSVLDSLGDKLEAQSRFRRKDTKEYFPRIVKDKEGLFQAIDKKEATKIADIIKQAEVESMRSRGRGLSQAEESALINQILFVDKRSNQPGWARDRQIQEITPELQKFYATPAESLHTYIRSAVEDLNRTSFFGKNKVEQVKGDQRFLDTDKSINNLLAEEIKSGRLSDEAANEVGKLLKSVLVGGDQTPAWLVREAKNLSHAGLLGNFWSAATQTGDVIIQLYTQDLRSTLDSIIRQATGRKFVDMRDYGLIDSITAEFASTSRTSKYVNKIFKYSLFSSVDKFGKNTALNAAISRAKRLADSPSGQTKLANRYAEAFGDDFPKLISELKSGKVSSLTKEYAFLELSRSQPITKFEMPQWWLDSPNVGRSALILKSFMLKQVDLARRDGINLIKEGKVAQGALKLTELGIILGLAGTGSELVKQVLSQGAAALTGREVQDIQLDVMDIPLNMIRTFGINEYTKDRILGVSRREAAERREAGDRGARAIKAEPHKAIPEMFIPPFRMWTDIATKDPAMYRYLIPGFGPYVAEQMRIIEAEEEKERRRLEKGGGKL